MESGKSFVYWFEQCYNSVVFLSVQNCFKYFSSVNSNRESVSRSVIWSVSQSVNLSICQSVNLSICQSVNLSICQSVNLSICQSVNLSNQKSVLTKGSKMYCRCHYTGHWTLDTGHWTLDTGHWTLDTGHCTHVPSAQNVSRQIISIGSITLTITLL